MVVIRIKHSDAQRFMGRFGWPMLIVWIILVLLGGYLGNIFYALIMSTFITLFVFGVIAMVYFAVTNK